MFFDTFALLCKNKGVSPNRACIDIGLSRTAVSKWKNGGAPNGSTVSKIAEYFNVSADYLLGNEKKPALQEDEPIVIRRLRKGTEKMSIEQQEKMLKILNASFDNLFDDES